MLLLVALVLALALLAERLVSRALRRVRAAAARWAPGGALAADTPRAVLVLGHGAGGSNGRDLDALDAALKARDDAVCELRGEDGRFLVVLSQVLYVKRYAREARVGFTQ